MNSSHAIAPRAGKSILRPVAIAVVAALLALVVGAALYAQHLGYPGGPLYKLVPATTRARPERSGTVAIFFSGDMGFNTGMGPPIARDIAAQGIPVLGINSLTAFAAHKTPAETTALVRDAALRALSWPGARRVMLIGQSFGADALLTGAGDLPPAIRARVAMIALIVPADTVSLHATPASIVDLGSDGAALPLARRLDWAPVLCIHGSAERGSLCPEWRQANVSDAELPGTHSLRHDTALVAATVLHALAPNPPTA